MNNTPNHLTCWVVIGLVVVLLCTVAGVIIGNVNDLGAHVATETSGIIRLATGIQK